MPTKDQVLQKLQENTDQCLTLLRSIERESKLMSDAQILCEVGIFVQEMKMRELRAMIESAFLECGQ